MPPAGLYGGSGSLPAGQTTAGITDTLLLDGANIDYLLAPNQHVWQFLDGFGFNHTFSLNDAENKIEIKNEKGPISSSIASGNGVISATGVLQLDGRLDLLNSLNAPAINTDQVSWNPTGFQDFTVVNANVTSALNIHSMPAGSDGQVKMITNTGNATATFVFNSSSAGTSQKFTMLPDYTSYELVRGATAFFMYSAAPTVNGWKLIN